MAKVKLASSISRLIATVVVAIIGVVGILPSNSASAVGEITGVYRIKNHHTNLCLSVNGGYVNGVTDMEQYTCGPGNGWEYQKFQFERSDVANWFLIHPKSMPGMCLALASESTNDGVRIIQEPCATNPLGQRIYTGRQMFTLQWEQTYPDGNTKNRIINLWAGKCVQVNSPVFSNHTRISQWNCFPSAGTSTADFSWDFKWLSHI